MSPPSLQVTFRRGLPLAAYCAFAGHEGQQSHHCEEIGPGLVADYAGDGQPIGLEIVHPSLVTLAAVNRALRALGQPTFTRAEFAPLRAA